MRLAWVFVFVGCAASASRTVYPTAPHSSTSDVFHGQRVDDPYRGLEADSAETRTWLAAQSSLAEQQLARLGTRASIERRIEGLSRIESAHSLQKRGDRYYWLVSGTTEQPLLVSSPTLDGTPMVILDPSASKEERFAGFTIDETGRYLAYGLAKGGGDWTTWHFRDLATGKDLPERIEHAKYYTPSFTRDGVGVYYSRFPEPPAGKELVEPDHDHKVYFHRMGSPMSEDVVVYERPEHPGWQFSTWVTKNNRYLVVTIGEDGQVGDRSQEQIVIFDRVTPGAIPFPAVDTFRAEYMPVGNIGSVFYFITNEGAPMKKIVALDLRDGAWRDVVPEAKSVIEDANIAADALFVTHLVDAHASVTRFTPNGSDPREVVLPGLGTVWGFNLEVSATELSYIFSGFAKPATVYLYDRETGKSRPWRAPKIAFDSSAFETTQEWATSKDGTKIPMFVTRKKGLAREGTSPTIMTGYGGFGLSSTPWFDTQTVWWLEHGGTLVTVNIRGGGEYGQAWHHAAWRSKRQTALDDFIACAEHLVAQKFTSNARLGMIGYSGGGTLVASVLVQRPDLFGAAIPYAGVHDMLRFQLFGQGAGWQGDMGFISDAKDFATLRAISPVHNARPARYPATLIVTGAVDVRVAPLHSFKLAAALQAAQRGSAPIVLRVHTSTGHGSGTQLSADIVHSAELVAFFAKYLGMP